MDAKRREEVAAKCAVAIDGVGRNASYGLSEDDLADLARCAAVLAKAEADDIEIHRTMMQTLHGPYVMGWVVYRDNGKQGHGYGFTLTQALEALPAVEAAPEVGL